MAMKILLVIFAGLLHAATAAPAAFTFLLLDNGASGDGVAVTLTEDEFAELSRGGPEGEGDGGDEDDPPPGEAFAVAMSSRIEVSKYRAPKPVLATRAFREDGELVVEFGQLAPKEGAEGGLTPSPRRVYLVAEGLEFVWPFVALRHRQVISPNVIPPTASGEPVVLESMSETPRVFRVLGIFTEDEAGAIISTALNATGDKAMKKSTVGSGTDEDGNDIAREDIGRTSENTWDHDSPAAKVLITRSFQLTNIKEDAGKKDGLQVVRYTPGQGYNTHPDYFTAGGRGEEDFDFNPYSGGSNRFATLFVYLNDPEEGGCTVFPRAPGVEPKRAMPPEAKGMFKAGTWEYNVNRDCYNKLAVPPEVGTAALFYSITPDGRIDPQSHHAACPLIKGTKWGANIWIWNKQRFGEIRTGEPRKVRMKNDADETVFISWERKDNGRIPPGASMDMNTFEFHRFKASFVSHKEKAFAEFTVQSRPKNQLWEIKRPRRHQQGRGEEGGDSSAERTLEGRNVLDVPVRITYEGGSMGTVAPGHAMRLNSFAGHAFNAWADGTDELVSSYLVRESPMAQAWVIQYDEEYGDEGEYYDGGYDEGYYEDEDSEDEEWYDEL